jgi:hypothetical protein
MHWPIPKATVMAPITAVQACGGAARRPSAVTATPIAGSEPPNMTAETSSVMA